MRASVGIAKAHILTFPWICDKNILKQTHSVACGLLGVGAFLLGARMALVAARGIVVAGTYTGGLLFPAFGACSLAGALLVALRMKNKKMGSY